MHSLTDCYRHKKVLVTGHTGFKGSRLALWLHRLGAEVIGFANDDTTNSWLYSKLPRDEVFLGDERGDIRDLRALQNIFSTYQPEVVFHLAAQALVRTAYDDPVHTMTTNIMGTMNLLECIRFSNPTMAAVIATSDKCYRNTGCQSGYHEAAPLGGDDPYSASKACAELVVSAYQKSFFRGKKYVASARAGNVIGGGDWAADRLVPDCIRHLANGEVIRLRNPGYVRPWQHVLEPLSGYLLLGARLLENRETYASAWNFGPAHDANVAVCDLVDEIITCWGAGSSCHDKTRGHDKPESPQLYLNANKAQDHLGWRPTWSLTRAIEETVKVYRMSQNGDPYRLSLDEIDAFEDDMMALNADPIGTSAA